MDKKKIIGVICTAVGVAGGVLLANLISEKMKKNEESGSGGKED